MMRALQRPPQRRAKRRRLTDGTAARLCASCPNDVWALDRQFDETEDLRRIKLLNIVGSPGNDTLDGGNGTDYLNGGPDTDTCTRGDTTARCDDQAGRP